MVTQTASQIVHLTDTAVERIRRLLEERGQQGQALRLFVSGGGCSGLQYGMALESQARESDHRFTSAGVEVVVDPLSMTYLAGSTIDYSEDLMAGGFRIDNPNAVASCGCGQSFRTEGNSAHSTESGCACR